MKIFYILLSLLIATSSFAQDLVLSGKISSYEFNETNKNKIYYTEAGKKFDPKKFILCDAQYNYTFRIPIKKIKAENITAVLFTVDPNTDPTEDYSCVDKIDVGKIIQAPEFSSNKSIKLKADLRPSRPCLMSVYYGASEDGKEKFVGHYTLQSGDTTLYITLRDAMYRYSASIYPPTADLMDEAYGAWGYNEDTQTLILYVNTHSNKRFEIYLDKKYDYSFKVREDNGKLQFEGAGTTTLTKQ